VRVVAKFLVLGVMVGGLLLVAGFMAGELWFKQPGPPATSGAETIVTLERGLGVNAIAARLKAAGVIEDARLFAVWTRIKGRGADLKAGEYAIQSESSMAEVLNLLVAGKSILHKLTIPEGLTSTQVVRLVAADPVLVEDAGPLPAEGALLPETYLFTRGTIRAEIIARMRKAHDDVLEELWPKRAADLPLASPEEAVILASIVEKETALPEERPRVAAVYVNRLRKRMLLQSDPTVIYGITKGEPLGRGLRQSELERATPYNTYQIAGLPPTPIDNPGRASIEAVLNPLQTKEIYFVATGNGGHVFSSTLAEHEANVRKWRKVERMQFAPAARLRRNPGGLGREP
jgi:UPF0755 protein